MTVTVKVRKSKSKDRIKSYIKGIKKIQKESVQVGYFTEQGIHKPSGLPYVMLADILHNGRQQKGDGWAIDIPPRPFLEMGMSTLTWTIQRSRKIKTEFRAWKRNPRNVEAKKQFLDAIGFVSSQSVKRVMGSPMFLTPNRPVTVRLKGGRQTPLVDTGDFRRSLSYRTSLRKQLMRARA